MKRIILGFVFLLLIAMFTSCAAMFDTAEYQKRIAESEMRQQEAEALQEEAEALQREANEIEAMAEGAEKERRKKKMLERFSDISSRGSDISSRGQALGSKIRQDLADSGSKLTEGEKMNKKMAMERAESSKNEYKLIRPLASRVVKIESKDLDTKYSDSLKGLMTIIGTSGSLEKMEFIDTEMYFASFDDSNYLYISVFTPKIFNTLQWDKYQRLTKVFKVIGKYWNNILSESIGVSEDFDGYIIEIGYLTKNFASSEYEDVEIVSFKIKSEDLLKLYNFEITDQQVLKNSLVLIDGVRIQPK